MPKLSVKDRLDAQQKTIQEAKLKAEKIKESEAKRLVKIFDKAGYFEQDIPDKDLEESLKALVSKAAGAQQKQ